MVNAALEVLALLAQRGHWQEAANAAVLQAAASGGQPPPARQAAEAALQEMATAQQGISSVLGAFLGWVQALHDEALTLHAKLSTPNDLLNVSGAICVCTMNMLLQWHA